MIVKCWRRSGYMAKVDEKFTRQFAENVMIYVAR